MTGGLANALLVNQHVTYKAASGKAAPNASLVCVVQDPASRRSQVVEQVREQHLRLHLAGCALLLRAARHTAGCQ